MINHSLKGFLLVVVISLLSSNPTSGQEGDKKKQKKFEPECEQQAVGDLLPKKKKKDKTQKNFNALVLPNISSNPTNGFLLGIGGALSWFMGPKETTRVSSAGFTVAVTSKKQLICFVKPNMYLKDDKYYMQGDWRFYIYSQPTFGLGTNAPYSGELPSALHWAGQWGEDDTVSFPMKFNYIKFHTVFNRQVKGDLYAGIGYHFDYYYAIKDQKLNLDTVPEEITPHYVYTKTYSYDTANYMLSGISLNFVYDSRDNLINPYEGYYANINYRYNFDFLGSDQDCSSLWLEFRTYLGLSKKTPRNVLAFWVFGDFNISGNLPYLTLPALGEDQRARSGRGYVNGRYRGNNIVYGEVEWRFPISPCSKILGGVIFVNATTADNQYRNIGLFQYVRPAVGFGVRVMVNKYFRTNLNLDFAIGSNSKGFYFSGQETF